MKFLVALLMLASTNVFAFPSPDQMRSNYQACQSEQGWQSRWGQHIVAFDYGSANQACMQRGTPSRPALMGCNSSSGFLYAGYYCQDLNLE